MMELAPKDDFTSQIYEALKTGYPCTSGSFGVVYRCTIKASEGTIEVAVKVFKVDPGRGKEKNEKATRRELMVWLRLNHPTIVPLLGIAYIEPPFPALVSRWMPSGTLYTYLEEATTLSTSDRVALAKGIADGLMYLHSENVIHGDLHPGNVLIDGSGNPRLTDFGLATVVGDAELQLSSTTASRVLDPRWRAPEVIGMEHDPGRPTFKSDIYSFGGLMFFVISGDVPWKEKKPHQIYVELSKRANPARPDNILDDYWDLIQRCWYWDPGDRPKAVEVLECIATKITTTLGKTEMAESTIRTTPPEMADSTIQTTAPKIASRTKHDTTFSNNPAPEGVQVVECHSPPKRHKNIVLFGETGAGKSSLINLMAGEQVVHVSPDTQYCVMQWKEYTIGFGDKSYKVFETIGLEESQLGIDDYLQAIEDIYRFIKKLDSLGGIDLLLFCIRAGNITATHQSNYQLFHEFLCERKVPIVLAITNLERERMMENWWERNERTFAKYQIQVADHACITAVNRSDARHRDLYAESRVAIRSLVEKFTADGQKQAWVGGDDLFVSLMRKLKGLLVVGSHVTRRDLVPHLTKCCGISRDVARQLANMIKQDAAT